MHEDGECRWRNGLWDEGSDPITGPIPTVKLFRTTCQLRRTALLEAGSEKYGNVNRAPDGPDL